MTDTTLTQNSGDGVQPVGKVVILYGTVKAVATDGTERVLAPNSPIFFGDHVITGPDGMVSIIFDAVLTQLDLGRMSDAFIDQDVLGGEYAAAAEDIAGEVADIQQALVEGDIEQILDLPAPAAGAGVAGQGGGTHPYPKFDVDGDAVLPGFGQETTGIVYTTLDPQGGGVVEEVPQVLVEEPAPEPEPEPEPVILAEEEEPIIPPPPPPPTPLTPSALFDSGQVDERALDEGDVLSGDDIGTIPLSDAETVSGSFSINSNGLPYVLVVGGVTITAPNTLVPGTYGYLLVNPDGTWTYNLTDNTLDHPDNIFTDGDGDRGADDIVQGEAFPASVTIGGFPAITGTLTIDILDDGPEIGNPQDAILANEEGNALIGDLDITYGADGPAETTYGDNEQVVVKALTLNPLNDEGNKVNHLDPVVDNDGNQMTSGEEGLIWIENGDGSWSAVVPYYNDYIGAEGGSIEPVEWNTVFTIIPGADNNSYEVVMYGELDGGETVETTVDVIDEGGGSSQPNYNATGIHYRTIDTDGDFKVYMTATIPGDSGGFDENQKVNWSNQGTGVGNDAINGSDDGTGTDYQTESDALIIRMYENEAFNPDGSLNPEHSDDLFSVTSATFTLDKLDAKDTHPHNITPEETSYWYAYEDGVLVGEGEVPGEHQGASDKSDQTLTIDSGDLDIGDDFDTVIFTGATLTDGDADGYRVQVDDMTVEEDTGDHTISVEYTATDGDLDHTTDTFDVTFDHDGDIEGTVENEVISGSTEGDEISGGGGDDVIMGHEGDDIISGGGGDDILFGDEGDDTLSGDAGDDQLVGGADNFDPGVDLDDTSDDTGGDTLDGGTGDDTIYAGEETDGDGSDTVTGGEGIDTYVDVNNDTDPPAGDGDVDMDTGENDIDTLVPPVEPDPTV